MSPMWSFVLYSLFIKCSNVLPKMYLIETKDKGGGNRGPKSEARLRDYDTFGSFHMGLGTDQLNGYEQATKKPFVYKEQQVNGGSSGPEERTRSPYETKTTSTTTTTSTTSSSTSTTSLSTTPTESDESGERTPDIEIENLGLINELTNKPSTSTEDELERKSASTEEPQHSTTSSRPDTKESNEEQIESSKQISEEDISKEDNPETTVEEVTDKKMPDNTTELYTVYYDKDEFQGNPEEMKIVDAGLSKNKKTDANLTSSDYTLKDSEIEVPAIPSETYTVYYDKDSKSS